MEILNRNQTDLFFAGIVFQNEPTQGGISDMWHALYNLPPTVLSDDNFNSLSDTWNDWIVSLDNDDLQGTSPTNDPVDLSPYKSNVPAAPRRPGS